MGDHTMHEVVGDLCNEDFDVLEVAPSVEEVKRKIEAVERGKKWRPIMVLAMDGAHVPTRPEEAKGKGKGRKKVRAKRANWEGEWKEAKGLIPEDDVRLCVIADGARWIWKLVNKLYPRAVEVLDYYHLSEHLHEVAELQYGHDPERAQEWIEATLTRLFSGEAYGVIWRLERMKPRSAEAKREINSLIGYLKENEDRVDYKFYRKG